MQLGVLQAATPYVHMVRFRNLIVHEYEEVDPGLVYAIATKHLAGFARFREEVDARG